jgi:hypothetical protein
MIMENEVNRASETASGMQHIARVDCLGTGKSAENEIIYGSNSKVTITKSKET